MSDGAAIPRKVSYTDADVANAAKFDRFVEGWFRWKLTAIGPQISKDNHHLMIVGEYRALRDPTDAGSTFGPKCRNYLCLPFRNEDFDDHVPPKFFAKNTNVWLAAHLPERVPASPAKVDGVMQYKGEEIDNSELEALKKDAMDATFAVASELWEDESNAEMEKLLDSVVYARLYYQKDKEGNRSDFPSLGDFCAELPEGEELVDPDHAIEQAVPAEEDDEAEVEEKPAKAVKTASKPAAKAASKPVAKKGKK